MIKTAEFVSPKHPDKMCDFIADSILDAFLARDKEARVAIEVMGGHGHITVSGEMRSAANIDIKKIVRQIVGKDYEVNVFADKQSPEIAHGVDRGGAGDQGVMIGYACNETETLMPLEYELARSLCRQICQKYPVDGKVQVTVDDRKVLAVVASFQNTETENLLRLVRSLVPAEVYLINPAGPWSIGGFDADSGLSGRKIIIDNYGPNIAVGGGSFSGKDYTKVDRSGAYMARKVAVDLLRKHEAKEVFVKFAYAIGEPKPVMAIASIAHSNVDEKLIDLVKHEDYDLSPRGIRKFLELDRPIYSQTAAWGHFGRGFKWDL